MGGLLAADSIYEFIHTRPDTNAPLWPNVVACLAFDTPVLPLSFTGHSAAHYLLFKYLGLHPQVFRNTADKAVGYVQDVHQTASGLFGAFSQPVGKSAPGIGQPAAALLAPAPASSSPSLERWGRWGQAAYAAGGALIAGAAVSTAYYHRANIESGCGFLTEHMQYVGALWDRDALGKRVRNLVEGETTHGILFRT